MCGITAYCGYGEAAPFLMQGLLKLEYRGYDSAGITVLRDGKLTTIKKKGRLGLLEEELKKYDTTGHVGIGHTRWATHGEPSDVNSHPHNNADNTISIVHNGIIENYREIKEMLTGLGYVFKSETDTEVIVHAIDYYYKGDLLEAVFKVIDIIKGSYGLCIMSTLEPDKIIVARKHSPICIGKADDCVVATSDIPALLEYTRDVYFVDDDEVAVMTKDDVTFYNKNHEVITKNINKIPNDIEAAKKEGYDYFMIKEINEQPRAIEQTLTGRVQGDHVVFEELDDIDFTNINKVVFVACGTAYHACICGAKIIEKATRLPVTYDVASEFRYSDPIIDEHTLCFFVSQSGETADTLAALRLAKENGCTTVGVCNVVGSTLSRDADHILYTWAGPEIAVASTKAYTTQVVLLTLVAMYIAQRLNMPVDQEVLTQISLLPGYIEKILKDDEIFANYAKYLENQHDCYFIGRQLDYASVLEGALKLKEISYVHADAYIAGELKHGSIALIEEGTVVVAVVTQPHVAPKTVSNIQETVARGANVLLFTTDKRDLNGVNNVYYLPEVNPLLMSVLIAVPLQLFAYHTAVQRGLDVDKPRNLAKSVTVE
ncbi:MAG: glutamine--fructose-6-phosphate transaminase (isomerizing) [Erysipelotrichaceae bacterium]|nr:glutamine--fructose-6-phosphate transaminase (isomerizing) [Erysipelotrichaceae bacterium]